MFKPGKAIVPSNASGTAPDAATTPGGIEISFDRGANRTRQATSCVIATNREAVAGNPLEISFDNATNWFTVATNTTIHIPVVIHRIRVRGLSGNTADYSVMGIV
jgi:hypothetical protein